MPKIVALSEDATRITGRVQYNSRSNDIIGFPLPIDESGLPMQGIYKARCASVIEGFFYDIESKQERQPAQYVNVVMAQPLDRNTPAFCLMLFSTDSKFVAAKVGNRWRHITNLLNAKGIKVIAFSSDSDPRYNAVMRNIMRFGKDNCQSTPEWFCAKFSTNVLYFPMQDVMHIGTKLRNAMLNKSNLKFGRNKISIQHLQVLVKTIPKELHNLTNYMITPSDRQNVETVIKIINY